MKPAKPVNKHKPKMLQMSTGMALLLDHVENRLEQTKAKNRPQRGNCAGTAAKQRAWARGLHPARATPEAQPRPATDAARLQSTSRT
jgi:hypothetical protein